MRCTALPYDPQVNDALTGYSHNAVSPIAMKERLPIVLSHKIAQLQPEEFFLGAGEVDLKVGAGQRAFLSGWPFRASPVQHSSMPRWASLGGWLDCKVGTGQRAEGRLLERVVRTCMPEQSQQGLAAGLPHVSKGHVSKPGLNWACEAVAPYLCHRYPVGAASTCWSLAMGWNA